MVQKQEQPLAGWAGVTATLRASPSCSGAWRAPRVEQAAWQPPRGGFRAAAQVGHRRHVVADHHLRACVHAHAAKPGRAAGQQATSGARSVPRSSSHGLTNDTLAPRPTGARRLGSPPPAAWQSDLDAASRQLPRRATSGRSSGTLARRLITAFPPAGSACRSRHSAGSRSRIVGNRSSSSAITSTPVSPPATTTKVGFSDHTSTLGEPPPRARGCAGACRAGPRLNDASRGRVHTRSGRDSADREQRFRAPRISSSFSSFATSPGAGDKARAPHFLVKKSDPPDTAAPRRQEPGAASACRGVHRLEPPRATAPEGARGCEQSSTR